MSGAAAKTHDPPLARRRFTGAEWDRLVQTGVFGPEERLELIDGEVVVMSPIGDVHAVVATLLDAELGRALVKGHHVREEKALRAGSHRVYPDLAVVMGDPDRYLRRSPTGADARLVVEVADSTPAHDLVSKARIYAEAGVEAYWVVVIPEQVVVVHGGPRRARSGATWAEVERVATGSIKAPALRRAIRIDRFMRR